MNLLQFAQRFKKENFHAGLIYEATGYLKALDDIISFIRAETNADPRNRMIDSAKLLESVIETTTDVSNFSEWARQQLINVSSDSVKAKLAGVDLGSDKVKSFLSDQASGKQ